MTGPKRTIVRHYANAAIRLAVLGGLAATLAGCYQHTEAQDNYPYDIRDRHPISLTRGRQTVEVFLGRHRGGLTPSQSADVLSFAQGWRHEATGGVILDVPTNKATARSASDTLRQIYSILAASGVPRNAVYVRRYRATGLSPASIKLNYTKLIAEAGPCGEWPKDLGPASGKQYISNRPYWNFGCSMQHNIAAMVANPADLVQPRGTAPAYEPRRTVAIENYSKGKKTSGAYSDYNQAKISDLGK